MYFYKNIILNIYKQNILTIFFSVISFLFAYNTILFAKTFVDISDSLVSGLKSILGFVVLVLVFVFIVNVVLYIVSDWGEGSANLKMRIVWGVVSIFITASLYGILNFIEDVTLGEGSNEVKDTREKIDQGDANPLEFSPPEGFIENTSDNPNTKTNEFNLGVE